MTSIYMLNRFYIWRLDVYFLTEYMQNILYIDLSWFIMCLAAYMGAAMIVWRQTAEVLVHGVLHKSELQLWVTFWCTLLTVKLPVFYLTGLQTFRSTRSVAVSKTFFQVGVAIRQPLSPAEQRARTINSDTSADPNLTKLLREISNYEFI